MRTRISEQAKLLGFDAVGFCAAELSVQAQQGLDAFLAAGAHGDMQWMEMHAARRRDPKTLWPDAKSVVVVGHNYAPEYNPLDLLEHKERGIISAYAGRRDYHDVMKKKLKALARWMAEEFTCEVKLFVDTAPVMEKPLAAQAGLGWQGKHTNLVSREFGSWLFLGEVFTTLELEPDAPAADRCGSCSACIDICPTQAITAPGKLDARRCIAYLTIEHKGQIPEEFRKAIGNRVYGCDDCLAACPWNKFAKASKEGHYTPPGAPELAELARLDDAAFRARFAGSAVKRIGRDRFVRNVLVAVGNSGEMALASVAEQMKADASPLVAEMAAWAAAELHGLHG